MNIFISATIVILYLNEINSFVYSPCFYSPNKFNGYFVHECGQLIGYLISSTKYENRIECNKLCIKMPNCFGIEYKKDTKKCLFYNSTTLSSTEDSDVDIWQKCIVDYKSEDRCTGNFVTYYDRDIELTKFSNLGSYENSSLSKCVDDCFLISECKYVVYNDVSGNCTHYPFYGDIVIKNDTSNSSLSIWTCNEDYLKSKTYNKTIKPNLKCTGKYELTNQSINLTNVFYNYFQTQSYQKCFDECNNFVNCTKVWYNYYDYYCIINIVSYKYHKKSFYNLTEYTWECLLNDANKILPTKKEKVLLKNGWKCMRLINNKNVFIANSSCHFKIPIANEFVSCFDFIENDEKRQNWNIQESCIIGQTFWIQKYEIKPINPSRIINGVTYDKFIRIFTGLTSFWLAYQGKLENIFIDDDISICRLFNGSQITKSSIKLGSIITRKQWHGYEPTNSQSFPTKPIFVAVSSVWTFSCVTTTACAYIIRKSQSEFMHLGNEFLNRFDDIPFNFMVDDMGNIYEGRGFKTISRAVNIANSISLVIATIPYNEESIVSYKSMFAIKNLIAYALEHDYIAKNYTLYLHHDLATKDVGNYFQKVIKLWYKYRNFSVKKCELNYYTIILNMIAILLIIVLLFICFYFLKHRNACNDCLKIKLNIKNHTIHLIYPESKLLLNDIDLKQFNHKINDTIIVEKKQYFKSNLQWKICQDLRLLWSYYIINYDVNDDKNVFKYLHQILGYIIISPEHVFVAEIILKCENELNKIILCTSSMNNIWNGINKLYFGKCLCEQFKIIKINSSMKCLPEELRLSFV